MAKKAALAKLSGDMLPDDVACDGEHVYVSAPYAEPPMVIEMLLDGTERHEMDKTGEVSRIVSGGAHLFGIAKSSQIVRIEKATGSTTTLATKLASVWALAIDEKYVYGSLNGTYPKYEDGGVIRVPREGGEVEYMFKGKLVSALAVDGDSIYYASEHQIWRKDKDGAPRALAPAHNPHMIAVAGELVIWTEFDSNGAVAAVGKNGGHRRNLADHPYSSGLVVVGSWIYWGKSSTKKSAAIWRMPISGGEAEPLAKFSSKGPRFATNGKVLCLVGHGDGGVYALGLD